MVGCEIGKEKEWLVLAQWLATFCQEHHLEDGDLLIFRFDGESQFKVKVYGKTACEKGAEVAETRSGSPVCSSIEDNTRGKNESVDLGNEEYNANCEKRMSKSGRSCCVSIWYCVGNHVTSGKRSEDDHAAATSNESILFKSMNLRFSVTYMRHYRYRMDIPKILAVTIYDPTGRSWPIKLNVRWTGYQTSCGDDKKFVRMLQGKRLYLGTLSFEFVKRSLAKVHIFIEGGNPMVTDVPDV